MDLQSGIPFWLIKSGLPYDYPKLRKSLDTDVLILGGGISGALAGYYLTNAGINCTIVDAREIGMGSTCASTSLLQYELDMPLHKLKNITGIDNAVKIYRLCEEAIGKLQKIAADVGLKEFANKKSLYFAAGKKHVPLLKDEYRIRKENNFKVDFLEGTEIKKEYNFYAPAAILSHTAAETNAYLFTHLLHQSIIKKGNQVYERTEVQKISYSKKNIIATTTSGEIIRAKKVIYATGYEAVNHVSKKIAKLFSTYANVSEKMDEMHWWNNAVLLWNTADPYLYMRSVNNNQIIIGGRDEPFYNPAKRDRLINIKTAALIKDFNNLFPEKLFKPRFKWTGTFAVTQDSLPFIGSYHKKPKSYFTLGFGGNGIIFSLLAAEILTDIIKNKFNPNAHLFSFDRM